METDVNAHEKYVDPSLNPFSNPDGSSKDWQLKEMLDWARGNELARRKTLPEAEQNRLAAVDAYMMKRMMG